MVFLFCNLYFTCHHFRDQGGAVFFLEFDDPFCFGAFGVYAGGLGFYVLDYGGLE